MFENISLETKVVVVEVVVVVVVVVVVEGVIVNQL